MNYESGKLRGPPPYITTGQGQIQDFSLMVAELIKWAYWYFWPHFCFHVPDFEPKDFFHKMPIDWPKI